MNCKKRSFEVLLCTRDVRQSKKYVRNVLLSYESTFGSLHIGNHTRLSQTLAAYMHLKRKYWGQVKYAFSLVSEMKILFFSIKQNSSLMARV